MTEWQQLAGESGGRRYRGTIYIGISEDWMADYIHSSTGNGTMQHIPVNTAMFKQVDVIASL